MGRRNWKHLATARAAERIRETEHALAQASKELSAPQSVEPPVRNPIEIYENGRWLTVDKSSRDFPFPVKLRVTPTWALDVLTDRNSNNRSVREDRVKRYIADILQGHWHVINNGFGFYSDGQLADGQHRLWAVVESQQTIEAIILFGMERAALPTIDEGAIRSTKDVANMMGIDTNYQRLAITNYVLEYKNTKRSTPRGDQIEFYMRHKDAVEFVVSRLKRVGVARAPVLAACMRAWYNADRTKLGRFLDILESGASTDTSETGAITLREFLLKNNNNSGPARMQAYRKTEAALVNFFKGLSISRLYGMDEEQFLLPEEKLEPVKKTA